MKKLFSFIAAAVAIQFVAQTGMAAELIKNQLYKDDLVKYKNFLDDPRPYFTLIENGKKLTSPENWAKVTHDQEARTS